MKYILKVRKYLEIKVYILFNLLLGVSARGERINVVREEDISTRFSVSCIVSLTLEPTFIELRKDSNDQVSNLQFCLFNISF
jgi:hypothetical protein